MSVWKRLVLTSSLGPSASSSGTEVVLLSLAVTADDAGDMMTTTQRPSHGSPFGTVDFQNKVKHVNTENPRCASSKDDPVLQEPEESRRRDTSSSLLLQEGSFAEGNQDLCATDPRLSEKGLSLFPLCNDPNKGDLLQEMRCIQSARFFSFLLTPQPGRV